MWPLFFKEAHTIHITLTAMKLAEEVGHCVVSKVARSKKNLLCLFIERNLQKITQ